MKRQVFPPGWDEARVRRLIDTYEHQTEEEAVAEDEAPFSSPRSTVMEIPTELVSEVRSLLASHRK